jgi:hypothetical protein
LFVAARQWPQEAFLEVAHDSMAFLDRETTLEGVFWPVGNDGWYSNGETKAAYDQQPVEAGTMAEAVLAALDLTRDEKYSAMFQRAYDWFHGRNSLGQVLVDQRSGGCCDGLQPHGLNRNQGAESTLAFLCTETHRFEIHARNNDDSKPTLTGA